MRNYELVFLSSQDRHSKPDVIADGIGNYLTLFQLELRCEARFPGPEKGEFYEEIRLDSGSRIRCGRHRGWTSPRFAGA